MKQTCLVTVAAFFAGIVLAAAQNTPPVSTSQIGDFTEYVNTQRSIDLTTVFADSDVSNGVRMTTVLGSIDLALFGQQKPITVANFLNYVNSGRYFKTDPTNQQLASSFVHRAITSSISIIQGGGYLGTVAPNPPAGAPPDSAQPTQVLTFPPIQNEPGISNRRGTIAMAQAGSDANSATSQWFINVIDNTALDNRENNAGPYTVFGRVVHGGMTIVDAIGNTPRVNVGAPFDNLPVRNYTAGSFIRVPNLVSIPSIQEIATLGFSVNSSNPNVTVALSGTKLLVTGNQVGSALVTVTAIDLDGATVSQSFTVNVVAAPGRIVQISTRMQVGTGDNVLIGGFIMRGASPKRVAVRGIGPSSGLPGALANPTLELRDGTGALVASNDNWGDAANKQDLMDANLAPTSPNESAILATLPSDPNNAFYTAIVRGAGGTTGLGLVEVYDIGSGPGSTLLNISTRGLVNADPDVLIGGFFVGGADPKQVLVRAIGPSLAAAGVPNPLANPTLGFFNGQGTQLDSNDDWMTSPQQGQIQASGLAPTDPKESAVLQTLAAGPYTAVVRGVNNGTGVGSVQIYQLN